MSEQPQIALHSGKRFAALRVLLYFVILTGILNVWWTSVQWLVTNGFVGNIYAGIQTASQEWTVPISTFRLLLGVVLLVGLLVYGRQTVARIPAQLRTLFLLLPFYLLFMDDWSTSIVLLAVGIMLWVFQERLAPYMSRVPPLLFPLIYVFLFTGSIVQTVGIAVLLCGILLFDVWMKEFFEPVWCLQSRLPGGLLLVLFIARLTVGLSMPFVLPYSLGILPVDYIPPFPSLSATLSGNTMLLTILSVFAALFVTKGQTMGRQT